jgi:hypothetical protein
MARFFSALALIALVARPSGTAERSRKIEFSDLPSTVRADLVAAGITESGFRGYVASVDTDTDRRVAEGDREQFIYYALQSAHFTDRPRIEPAVSARRFVDGLSPTARQRLLADDASVPAGTLPPAEHARVADLLRALAGPARDARLVYFKELLASPSDRAAPVARGGSPDAWYPDYVRVARFLYKKEFSSGQDAAAVASLYQTRPHSTDTQVDAGFGVFTGLAVLRALEPTLRIRRALIVGPGLDVSPRTDLVDDADPQSHQSLAVADALLALALSPEDGLHVHAVDVNPRVVRVVQSLARGPVTWRVFPGLPETSEQPFTPDYQTYLRGLGQAIGSTMDDQGSVPSDRRYRHAIAVRASVTRALSAERLNVITERRVDEPPVDLVIATNVLPYFDDRQLVLALSNIAAMLAPGGYFLHNESRPGLSAASAAIGLPARHMRTAILGGRKERPLYDVIWIHQKLQ